MTVKELIEYLQQFNENKKVFINNSFDSKVNDYKIDSIDEYPNSIIIWFY